MGTLLRHLAYKILEKTERGGENEMVDFFFYRVINGKRTCNPENKSLKMVPARFVDAVTEMLTAEGLDLDGKPIQG